MESTFLIPTRVNFIDIKFDVIVDLNDSVIISGSDFHQIWVVNATAARSLHLSNIITLSWLRLFYKVPQILATSI